MKKYLIGLLLLATGSANAACEFVDGSTMENCQQFHTDANVLIEWDKPAGLVKETKFVIQNTDTGHWLGNQTVVDRNHTGAYVVLPSGNYAVVIWAVSNTDMAGKGSEATAFIVTPGVPRHPTTYTIRVL